MLINLKMEHSEYTYTNQMQNLELKIHNNDLSTLVENEKFHEFKHKIKVDNTSYSTITIYYDLGQLSKLVSLIQEVNLFY